MRLPRAIFLALATLPAWPAATAVAQQAPETPNVVNVLGLDGVRRGAKGKLTIQGGTLKFEAGSARAQLPVPSIEDVFTGDDSQRMVGGTLGTLSMFGPYGSGRFLSLFRKKIDVLTVEYRDANGALHGVIFTLPSGQAAAVKKQLVAQGARASIPVEEEMKQREKQKEKKQ